VVAKPKPKYSFDLMPPPETITEDVSATEVMTTKVSGIMYDRYNPSAILNINGSDYLVRTGDIVNGYKILSIAKDRVTVQNGANVYKAGVGEMFTGNGMNFNTVSNLESKFGGRKNSANK
jgi:Tfp pilus assembly protein PilP